MLFWHAPFMLGFSWEWSSTDGYSIAGGSAPWALEASALFLFVYLLLMFAPQAEPGGQIVGWWRRFAAFWLDFIFAMAILAPIVGLIPVYMEWKRTGVFAWMFERDTPAPGDTLTSALSGFLMTLIFLFYFVIPLIRARPSPGACAMGYQIVGDGGLSVGLTTALKRTVAGFTFLGDRKRSVAKIDGWFRTHPVKFK